MEICPLNEEKSHNVEQMLSMDKQGTQTTNNCTDDTHTDNPKT